MLQKNLRAIVNAESDASGCASVMQRDVADNCFDVPGRCLGLRLASGPFADPDFHLLIRHGATLFNVVFGFAKGCYE